MGVLVLESGANYHHQHAEGADAEGAHEHGAAAWVVELVEGEERRKIGRERGTLPALSMKRTPRRVPTVMTGFCSAFTRSCCLVDLTPAFLAIRGR